MSGDPLSEPLVWSVRPCTRNWPLAIGVVVLILLLSLAVQLYFEGPFWALLTLVLLGLAVAPHYVSARHELSEEGVKVRGLLVTYSRPWSEIAGRFPDRDGVMLSPLSTPSKLAYTRGIYLRFSENRDEVLERVEAYVARASGGDDEPAGDDGAHG